MRRLWLQIVHTSGATIATIVASLFTMMITARVLGPEGRGIFVAATSWVGLFATVGTLSLGQVLVHRIAGRQVDEWLEETAGSTLAITICASVIGWIVFAALFVSTRGRLFGSLPFSLLAFAFVSLPLLMWAETGRYVLVALDALPSANWAQVLGAVASVCGVVLLVGILRVGVAGAVAAAVLANASVAGWIMLRIMRSARRLRPRWPVVRELLGGSTRLHLSAVGNFVYAQASVLVLNYYRPAAETGYYQFAVQLFGFALIVSTAISMVSFTVVAKKGPNAAWPEQRTLIGQAMILVTLIGCIGYFLAPWAVRIVAGEKFAPAVPLFRTILPALYGATLATIMASQWVGRGLFLQAALMTIAVAAISLGLDLFFVPRLGMRGALVSTLITYAISLLGNGGMAVWVQRQWRLSKAETP